MINQRSMGAHRIPWLYFLPICFALLPQGFAKNTNLQTADQPDSITNKSILANDTLYVSGIGSDSSDGTRPTEFSGQVIQTLRNLQTVLRHSGMDFDNIASINIYLTSIDDIPASNAIYWKMMGQARPARNILTVASLPNRNRIQINCIAVANNRQRRLIWPAGWLRGTQQDPPAVLVGEMLYMSAQEGRDPITGKRPADFAAEVDWALANVATVLRSAHMSMKNVVWVNPYITNGSQYELMGKIYSSYFEFGNTPARGTIEVLGLPKGNHIVFSCIAGSDLSKRTVVRPPNMPPSSTASPGVLYGDTLYLSAKDGFIPGQGMVTSDRLLQTRQSMRNLLDGLQEADMSFSDVVFSTIYLKNIDDTETIGKLYSSFFQGELPATSIIQQNQNLSDEAWEQISFIAVKCHLTDKKCH